MTDQTTEDKLRAALEQIANAEECRGYAFDDYVEGHNDARKAAADIAREALALPRGESVSDVRPVAWAAQRAITNLQSGKYMACQVTLLPERRGDNRIALFLTPQATEHHEAVRRAALEEAAKACEQQSDVFASTEYATPQPIGSISERFACTSCADAIRALAKPPATTQEHDAI